MEHIVALTDIGERPVGAAGAQAAAAYLERAASAVAAAARKAGYDANVTLDAVAGSFASDFLGFQFENAYAGVENVVLQISPPAPRPSSRLPSILLVAHYDTHVGTPGAADAAACVAAALEAARALVAGGGLAAPLAVLLNGGEEALLVGAAGFVASHPAAKHVGAFINVEASGADGPSVLFQQSSVAAAAAYAKGAARPRGTVIVQDAFDAGVLPADTDFRALAARGRGDGAAPGVDLALILGAEIYHTRHDVPSRLHPGTVQALGDDVVGVARALAATLADRAARGAAGLDDDAGGTAVYFDLLGRVMIVYSTATGFWLHLAPLPLALAAFLAAPRAARAAALRAAAATAASAALAVAVPAVAGGALALATRRPMAWYGVGSWRGVAAFSAFALSGLTAPHARSRAPPATAALGLALAAAACAAALACAGVASAYVPAAWALSSLAASTPLLAHHPLLALGPALLSFTPNGIALTLHTLQKSSFGGTPAPLPWSLALGDAAAGAATGASLLAGMAGFGPWLARALRAKGVAAVFVAAVGLWSFAALAAPHPYSPAAPKKLYLALEHRGCGNGGGGAGSVWAVGGVDAVPVAAALAPSWTPAARGDPKRDRAWLAMHPLGQFALDTETRAAGAPAAARRSARGGCPSATLERTPSPDRPGADRVAVALRASREQAFGALNVTARLLDWSLSPRAADAPPGAVADAGAVPIASRIIRLAGPVAAAADGYRFWVEVPAGAPVALAAALAAVGAGAPGDAAVAEMPPWASTAVFEAWTGEWAV